MKKFAVRVSWYPFVCYYTATSKGALRKEFDKYHGEKTNKYIHINRSY